MKIWKPLELAQFAREHSPFYCELYGKKRFESWEDIPILAQESFWEHNQFAASRVLTGASEGMIFRSGGTTGSPKFSIFTMSEWEAFTSEFAAGMDQAGFADGDSVANLFYAGDLYASFLFINKSIEKMQTKVSSLPVGGHLPLESMIECLKAYRADVICGVPTTLMNIRAASDGPLPMVKKIFYGGESLFDDQFELLRETFPNARFSSIGYASVDGGHLGHSVGTDPRGVHRVFSKTSLMEIIDEETSEVITTPNQPGKLVYTNLIRSLMPIIRYPVGDSASWLTGHVGERFQLLGRTDEGARLGPVTFNRDDFVAILKKLDITASVLGFQFEIDRIKGLDRLSIKMALSTPGTIGLSEIIECTLLSERVMLAKSIEAGIIASPQIILTELENLAVNKRTGKLKLVIDKRFKS